MKKYLSIAILFSLFIFPAYVFAASFNVTNIGSLSTEGKNYNDWWYMGSSPTIKGTASENSKVEYNLDGQMGSVTADSQGNWSVPTSFTDKGDYYMAFTSGGQTLDFTLHFGQEYTATAQSSSTTQSTSAVPQTGSTQVIALIISSALMGIGALFVDKYNVKKNFEKSVIKDLD